MGRAKQIVVKPIGTTGARRIIQRLHYSGKYVNNSQIHLGAFLEGRCGGVMAFGPSISKYMHRLVTGTAQRECIELNRMAFADWLPRNSESRCLSIAMRMLRKSQPHLKWVVSFADACQCGDGAIYRASGFVLTSIHKNDKLAIDPGDGKVKALIAAYHMKKGNEFRRWQKLHGYQLRYVYFLKPEEQCNLTCEVIPFSRIREMGIGMYRGKRRAGSIGSDAPTVQVGEGGAAPTPALQSWAVDGKKRTTTDPEKN